MVLQMYEQSILQRSERVASAHLCKPKKEFFCVFRGAGGGGLCDAKLNSPTASQGRGHLCEAAARGRRAAE